jgi:tRNA threonylcarbamoyladenosine biosynthesis protein TsaB
MTRTLVIECATEACSLALFEGKYLVAHRHEILGRGHAEHLVPMIANLPDKGRADEIRVSLGPGSFTGVRIGLAAARALGLAWDAPVLGYPTLALVAAQCSVTGAVLPGSLEIRDPPDILICMAGGHGEWFVQPFDAARDPAGPLRSLPPEEAVAAYDHPYVVGTQAEAFVALRGFGTARRALPDARWAAWLNAGLLTTQLSPIYGRGPDARLPQ